MSDLRTAAQQALEALEDARTFTGAWPTGSKAITNLRAALAQQAEPVEPVEPVAWNWMLDGLPYGRACYGDPPDADIAERAAAAGRTVRLLYTAPPQRKQAEPQGCATEEDCTKQPWCRIRGECQRKQAEPVEPVAWVNQANLASARLTRDRGGQGDTHTWSETRSNYHGVPLYTAPPQRKPLTEEEILAAVGWERAEMYMKLAPNFPVDEAKQETLKNARAVEKASWEKNHG